MPLSWVVGGQDVTLAIKCVADKELTSCIVGFHFKDRLGQVIFAENTFLQYQLSPPHIPADSEFVTAFEFRMPVLPPGEYSISPAIAEGTQDNHVQHHWMHDALMVRVHARSICFRDRSRRHRRRIPGQHGSQTHPHLMRLCPH